jgi:ABC-type dipeptide/oligopeptide/nickel transport system ATPase subunit
MPGSHLLSLVGASKTYSSGLGLFRAAAAHRAFGPVDLELRQGECLAVVGRSGAGKSTLGRCLAGLEKLTQGKLLAGPDREDVTRHGLGPAAQLLFQDSPTAMNPAWSVSAILNEALALAGRGTAKVETGFLLQQVGLTQDLLTRRPDQLSGGQRRRVAIARALAVPSLRVLILDEPFSGLEATSAERIAMLLDKLRIEQGVALLLITHDLASVGRLASRLAVMAEGQVVEELSLADFPGAAQHAETRALIEAMLPGVAV